MFHAVSWYVANQQATSWRNKYQASNRDGLPGIGVVPFWKLGSKITLGLGTVRVQGRSPHREPGNKSLETEKIIRNVQ